MPSTVNKKRYQSWGRYPKLRPPCDVKIVEWRHEPPNWKSLDRSVLPYGYGRSYGDSCLNEDGTLLDMRGLKLFIEFDQTNGVLRCEAGVTLAEILDLIVPRGWFLPTVPGTKIVSVGGAIANDIHGKNHHSAGTFGRHIRRFELLRSTGECFICSPTENVELYQATIGGLGLTGLILWAEIGLKRVASPFIETEKIRFANVDELFELTAESEHDYEYTVSWIDCF